MKRAQGGIHNQTSRRPGPPSGRTARGSPPLRAPQGGHHQGAAGRAVGRPPPLLSPRLGARLGPPVPRCFAPFPPALSGRPDAAAPRNHGSAAPGMRPEGRGMPGKWRRRRREGTGTAPPQTPSLRTGPGLLRGEMEGVGHFLCGQGKERPFWGDSRGAKRRAVATARTAVSAPCRKTPSPATSHSYFSYFRDRRHSCVVPGSGRTLVKKLFQCKYNYVFQYIWNYIHTPCNSIPRSLYKVSQTLFRLQTHACVPLKGQKQPLTTAIFFLTPGLNLNSW